MTAPAPAAAEFVTLDHEPFLVIREVDLLPPFLMTVVSHSDHWLFLSSRGGLTAGRVSSAGALFPYVTDDKLHACHPHTGPHTTLRVETALGPLLWQPFARENDDPRIKRHLYKSALGNQVVFEEVQEALGLVFRARWSTSERYGFVRTVSLENTGRAAVRLELVDGLLDLMPAGVPPAVQQGSSCLVNAYTRADLDAPTGLLTVALQAAIVDQPVAAESLTTTTVFAHGLPDAQVLLSGEQLSAFRRGQPVVSERSLTGRRAAFLVKASLALKPGEVRRFRLVADVERDHLQVAALRQRLVDPAGLDAELEASIADGSAALRRNVGSADGLQHTADPRVVWHHFANVLFNNMRGGVFADGHRVGWADFTRFLAQRNGPLAERLRPALAGQSGHTTVSALRAWAEAQGDLDLVRLANEYLPLTFSRRHGDPSRPWNTFAIRLKNPDGSRALDYQGNWRDIFQNWEALCASHPAFLESVVATFVDASTADGFNPYRITRAGIDWEVPEEDNPWSTIGYWGDHQLVYLTRLLEALERAHPGRLLQLLGRRWFSYADVPYRLRSASELAQHPRDTIVFDKAAHARAMKRAEAVGGDGKLLHDAEGRLVRATLLEKLLVPVLAKLCNLVLDGGVWMNTQRPEWNDANNALVGEGLSVVTLCQLRRHLVVLAGLFSRAGEAEVALSSSVATWLSETSRTLQRHQGLLGAPTASDEARRALLDELQLAFEAHRARVYGPGLGAPTPVKPGEAAALCRVALGYVEHSIRANRRPDGLYHSYNLLSLRPGAAAVAPLYEMLEGQVAVLGAGLLSAQESLRLLDALFESRLFRVDQSSFLLYPERRLPGFLEKNAVPPGEVGENPLLAALLEQGDRRLVARDVEGTVHFAGHLRTVDDVKRTLGALLGDQRFAALAERHADATVGAFERVFGFKGFTGRSGTMYGYEGLGCIYWHMVSKLLLAVQEVQQAAAREGAPAQQRAALARAYYRVRLGLCFNKPAEVYGAFPTDPYSHTPRHAGAQQPGMTGSVKEEVLTRLGELGVEVEGGLVAFRPSLLSRSELLHAPASFEWVDADGVPRRRPLEPGQLGFTFCQVPVLYRLGDQRAHLLRWAGGREEERPGTALDEAASAAVLGRTGALRELVVSFTPEDLLQESEAA